MFAHDRFDVEICLRLQMGDVFANEFVDLSSCIWNGLGDVESIKKLDGSALKIHKGFLQMKHERSRLSLEHQDLFLQDVG